MRFSGGKLDFSRVDKKIGFSEILPSEQSIFIDAFIKFESLTWNQIYSDNGFDYKEYKESINETYRNINTYKFRVSQKYRCHGYREKNLFFVIGFEIDHKLSDHG